MTPSATPQSPQGDNLAGANSIGAHPVGGPADGPDTTPEVAGDDSIVSVNQRAPAASNRAAKAIVIVLGSALLLGAGLFAFQRWAGQAKENIKETAKSTKANLGAQAKSMLNPEGGSGRGAHRESKLGAAGEPLPAPGSPAASATAAGATPVEGVRPLRGPDGQILINSAGRALGVDSRGQVIEVPAIEPIGADKAGAERSGPLTLNDEAAKRGSGGSWTGAGATANSGTAKKPPSRYGGALMADGSGQAGPGSAGGASSAHGGTAGAAEEPNARTSMASEVLKSLLAAKQGKTDAGAAAPRSALLEGEGTRPPAPNGQGGQGGQSGHNGGPVSSQLTSSATPVARARLMPDQDLMLPKGRQVDCVLTTRIVNELPGFTSCALTQNLYSANGKVLLLGRGSEVTGEYGVSNQMGLRRLFIVWTRVRTPEGVEVDLQSPGADALGTSGVPGYLEQRWMERIGAALLISVMKDVFELEIARQRSNNDSTTVLLGPTPGQNTMQAGQDIGEQVVKQTLNVKPTLYINEGSRVSIYVARDLDFAPVYSLRTLAAADPAAPKGTAR